MDIINLYDNYNSYFNADFKAIFDLLSKIAHKNNYKLYIIGGLVRDMLLNQPSRDIDITIEGNAIEFAHILEKECGAKILSIHKDFGTVKVLINGEKIDLASTRSESYPKAGHLPHVTEIGCELKNDVLRRDFTINSLALSLNKENFADLIDFVEGYKDLKNKKIRILHEKSFIDDPTRIIRGLKYASRLDFELEARTYELQNEYLKKINYDMCYKRVKQEIKKTFNVPICGEFEKFITQGIYKLVTPKAVEMPKIDIDLLVKKFKIKHPWIVYLGLITTEIDWLELTKDEKEVIANVENLSSKSFHSDFDIYKAFEKQKLETLILLAAKGQEKSVTKFLDHLRKIKLEINGNDLIKLGIKPSKKFAEAFDFILKKKLENPTLTKEEELELIKNHLLS